MSTLQERHTHFAGDKITSDIPDPRVDVPRSARGYEQLLPATDDQVKAAIRAELIVVLEDKGEILPAANSTLGRLWALVNDSKSTLTDCEEVVLLDPALAGRIMRFANSAMYNAHADSVNRALQIIGLRCVREMVFNSGIFDQFSALGVPTGWGPFWLRNIFVARLTERICGTYFQPNGSEYMAGLIHDVGWLFLSYYAPDEFAQILVSRKAVSVAEAEHLPFSHARIAAALAARASMPDSVIDSVAQHHDHLVEDGHRISPVSGDARFLSVVMGLCDKIADIKVMDLFKRANPTMEQIIAGPEAVYLKSLGKKLDLDSMIEKEMARAEELYKIFFSEP